MEMLNRAIEDAADFKAFRDALTKRNDRIEAEAHRGSENRQQRRARERAERKSANKARPKVKA